MRQPIEPKFYIMQDGILAAEVTRAPGHRVTVTFWPQRNRLQHVWYALRHGHSSFTLTPTTAKKLGTVLHIQAGGQS